MRKLAPAGGKGSLGAGISTLCDSPEPAVRNGRRGLHSLVFASGGRPPGGWRRVTETALSSSPFRFPPFNFICPFSSLFFLSFSKVNSVYAGRSFRRSSLDTRKVMYCGRLVVFLLAQGQLPYAVCARRESEPFRCQKLKNMDRECTDGCCSLGPCGSVLGPGGAATESQCVRDIHLRD